MSQALVLCPGTDICFANLFGYPARVDTFMQDNISSTISGDTRDTVDNGSSNLNKGTVTATAQDFRESPIRLNEKVLQQQPISDTITGQHVSQSPLGQQSTRDPNKGASMAGQNSSPKNMLGQPGLMGSQNAKIPPFGGAGSGGLCHCPKKGPGFQGQQVQPLQQLLLALAAQLQQQQQQLYATTTSIVLGGQKTPIKMLPNPSNL